MAVNTETAIAQTAMGHRPTLDIIRAAAVLLVIGVHLAGQARALIPGGDIGVNVFFVLSGFLITRLLIEERSKNGAIHIWGFMRRRAARLFPALGLLVVWVIIAEYVFEIYGDPSGVASGLLATVFYARNWLGVAGVSEPALGIAWSLSVEEQFYLVWPFFFVAVSGRFTKQSAGRVTLAVFIVAVIQTALRSVFLGHSVGTLKLATDANGLIALMAGCTLAFYLNPEPLQNKRAKNAARLVGLTGSLILGAFVLFVDSSSTFLPRGGWAIAALATVAVLVGSLRGFEPEAGASWRRMRWIGAHSYGLYLWHLPMFILVRHSAIELGVVGTRVVALVLTLLVSWASMRWVEAPARSWLLRAHARPTTATPVPGVVDVTDDLDLRQSASANGHVLGTKQHPS